MNFTKNQIIIAGIVLAVILLLTLIFTGVIPGLRQKGSNDPLKGNLTVWGVFDDEIAVQSTLISEFTAKHPNVAITYRQVDPRTYETDLVNALAAGTGPDVFYVQNTWLSKHSNKLSPRDPKLFTVVNFGDLFPQVVVKDFTKDGSIYAMPLYIDTLVTLYNKNMFDAAGIAQVPKTWSEFEAIIPQLRITDESGRLTQTAAAIGGSNKNINNANDLLYQMMLQQGVEMVSAEKTEVKFANQGQKPLDYYFSFANQRSPNYTWDRGQHYSIDAFAEESVAMIFNYGYQLQELKNKNPFLNIGVAPMLQLNPSKGITYANYWGLGVSATSQNKDLAWVFVDQATTDGVTNARYLNATKRSPALRSLIAVSLNDVEAGIFAKQALMAASWYQPDGSAVSSIFSNMLELISAGQLNSNKALQQAASQVSELLGR
jgi:multiple sugar transport system substrate-binding protein